MKTVVLGADSHAKVLLDMIQSVSDLEPPNILGGNTSG